MRTRAAKFESMEYPLEMDCKAETIAKISEEGWQMPLGQCESQKNRQPKNRNPAAATEQASEEISQISTPETYSNIFCSFLMFIIIHGVIAVQFRTL